MKSLDNLTGKDQLATSIPFFKPIRECQDFTKELIGDYSDDQIDEINGLVQDIATETLVRFMNFLFQAETDKQLIARIICLQKLFNNKHGNWSALAEGHDVTIKTIRAERDRIQKETGLYIQ